MIKDNIVLRSGGALRRKHGSHWTLSPWMTLLLVLNMIKKMTYLSSLAGRDSKGWLPVRRSSYECYAKPMHPRRRMLPSICLV